MPQSFKSLHRPAWGPSGVFAFMLLVVFGVECGIMLVLWGVPENLRGRWIDALIDSVVLTAALAPILWLAMVRPLQRLSASRGKLLRQLFDAQEQERSRIARDLHDELGQHLTAIMIGLRTIEQAADLPQAMERARTVAAAGAAGLSEVRRIARALRPTVLEDLGLVTAIERLGEEFQSVNGVPVELALSIDPSTRFAQQVELCVFRVVQESLTNAAKHAGAQRLRVRLAASNAMISVLVADDGHGFDPDETMGSSFGLNGMRERVELFGGRFEVKSKPGGGTTILAEVPVEGAGDS